MARDFQSFAGPGDRNLPMTEVSGYQPVSRIGEVVMNAFGTPARMGTLHGLRRCVAILTYSRFALLRS